MADTIERTIYKLEIDDSGYIRGVESASNSTKRFAEEQVRANQRLKENEATLKTSADLVEKNRKALETYSGTDTKVKKELETNLKISIEQHQQLEKFVTNVRAAYDKAKISADQFAQTSQRAGQIQTETTGGRIPGPTIIPPQVIPPIIPPIAFEDFDLSEILSQNTIEFES